MPNKYTDGPELPDNTTGEVPTSTTTPDTAPNTADTATTGTNRTEYTDGPEPTQDEI